MAELLEAHGPRFGDGAGDFLGFLADLFVEEAKSEPASPAGFGVPLVVAQPIGEARVPTAPVGFQQEASIGITGVGHPFDGSTARESDLPDGFGQPGAGEGSQEPSLQLAPRWYISWAALFQHAAEQSDPGFAPPGHVRQAVRVTGSRGSWLSGIPCNSNAVSCETTTGGPTARTAAQMSWCHAGGQPCIRYTPG